MTIVLNGDSGISTPMYGGSIASNAVTPSVSMKNRIINGACVIDQRNAGASITPSLASGDVYFLDRWVAQGSQNSKLSFQQNAGSVTPPAGFTNYMGVTSTSAYSIGTGDYFDVYQYIEGFNVADLGFGTANAKTITLSFWARSSLTGTFGGVVSNNNYSRCYPYSYTINTANTWQYVTVTIAGDTGGTWLTNNGRGMQVSFGIACGSTYAGAAGSWSGTQYLGVTGQTSVVGTNGATFYITGVQLEVGSSATSFDYRPYGTEFALCQRYYQKAPITYGAAISATTLGTCYDYPVVMRATPTIALLTSTPYAEIPLTTGYTASGATISGYTYAGGSDFRVTGFSGMTTGRAPFLLDNNQVSCSAEL